MKPHTELEELEGISEIIQWNSCLLYVGDRPNLGSLTVTQESTPPHSHQTLQYVPSSFKLDQWFSLSPSKNQCTLQNAEMVFAFPLTSPQWSFRAHVACGPEQTDCSGCQQRDANRRAEMENRATPLTNMVFVLQNKLHLSWTVLRTNR